jgi:TRAP transporter TAXI family solute receptor
MYRVRLRRVRWAFAALPALVASLLATALFISSLSPAEAGKRKWRTEASEAMAAQPTSNIQEEINRNTIAIVSGNLNGTYLSIAYDLSAVLDDGNNFRVLPMIGKGAAQNIRDVRYLKGVDLGIAQSDLLGYFRQTGELGNLEDRIVYIAKLFNEELHIIVRDSSGITSVDQLAGKKVNVSDAGSGTQLSAKFMFGLLGIKFQEVNMGQADAFEKLKTGEIDATILIAGKPAASMAKLRAADGYRILPVPYPKALQRDYLPAVLTSQDYPNLIEPGREVETLAIGAVLIAYNWPKDSDRYRRLASFVERFFPRLAEFQKPPRHPKWLETNLAATLPGWTRFDVAEEWLRNNRNAPHVQAPSREQFDAFAASRGTPTTPEERDRLYRDFLKWSEAQGRR